VAFSIFSNQTILLLEKREVLIEAVVYNFHNGDFEDIPKHGLPLVFEITYIFLYTDTLRSGEKLQVKTETWKK